jgi:uncharacterized protein (DUF983 family)
MAEDRLPEGLRAHVSASCPKCRRRFGFHGVPCEPPPCPKCGHQIPHEDMGLERAAFREMLEVLRAKRAAEDGQGGEGPGGGAGTGG